MKMVRRPWKIREGDAGIVATESPLAAQTGAEILARGVNYAASDPR